MSEQIEQGLPVEIVETPVEQVTEPVEIVEPTEPIEQSEEAEEAEEAEEESQEKKKSGGLDKRFAKLTKEKALQQQEIEYWKNKALEQSQPVQAQVQAQNKPTLAQFNNNVELYTEALTDWKLDQKLAVQNQQSQQSRVLDTYNSRVADFTKSHPDFHEVLASVSDMQVSADITQAIVESDLGPALAYHLADNPDEIERLNKLTPNRRLIEIGKIETKLSTPTKPITVKAAKAAPAPIKPSTGSPAKIEKSIYEMSPAELMAHRNKQQRR